MIIKIIIFGFLTFDNFLMSIFKKHSDILSKFRIVLQVNTH